jgi:DNA-binding protein Fis
MAAENTNVASPSTELNGQDVVITTNDTRNFTVKILVARVSKTINNMIQDLGDGLDLSAGIPLPNVDGPIFEKVLEWCEEHKSKFMKLYLTLSKIIVWLVHRKF